MPKKIDLRKKPRVLSRDPEDIERNKKMEGEMEDYRDRLNRMHEAEETLRKVLHEKDNKIAELKANVLMLQDRNSRLIGGLERSEHEERRLKELVDSLCFHVGKLQSQ